MCTRGDKYSIKSSGHQQSITRGLLSSNQQQYFQQHQAFIAAAAAAVAAGSAKSSQGVPAALDLSRSVQVSQAQQQQQQQLCQTAAIGTLYEYQARLRGLGIPMGYPPHLIHPHLQATHPSLPPGFHHPPGLPANLLAYLYAKQARGLGAPGCLMGSPPGAGFPLNEDPKPSHSYIGIIAMAILSSKEKKLVLSDIYQWILHNYPYFRRRGPGWRNSIRHNLSLNDCFVKSGRSANGKGHYWAIHPANVEDFEKGDFRRRRAQRKVRRAMGLSVPDDDDSPSSSPPCTTPSNDVVLNWQSRFFPRTSENQTDHHPTTGQGYHHPLFRDYSANGRAQGSPHKQDNVSSHYSAPFGYLSEKSNEFKIESIHRVASLVPEHRQPVPRKRLFDVESLLAPDSVQPESKIKKIDEEDIRENQAINCGDSEKTGTITDTIETKSHDNNKSIVGYHNDLQTCKTQLSRECKLERDEFHSSPDLSRESLEKYKSSEMSISHRYKLDNLIDYNDKELVNSGGQESDVNDEVGSYCEEEEQEISVDEESDGEGLRVGERRGDEIRDNVEGRGEKAENGTKHHLLKSNMSSLKNKIAKIEPFPLSSDKFRSVSSSNDQHPALASRQEQDDRISDDTRKDVNTVHNESRDFHLSKSDSITQARKNATLSDDDEQINKNIGNQGDKSQDNHHGNVSHMTSQRFKISGEGQKDDSWGRYQTDLMRPWGAGLQLAPQLLASAYSQWSHQFLKQQRRLTADETKVKYLIPKRQNDDGVSKSENLRDDNEFDDNDNDHDDDNDDDDDDDEYSCTVEKLNFNDDVLEVTNDSTVRQIKTKSS